jgi:DNA repair protein RecO (recombination protein O)
MSENFIELDGLVIRDVKVGERDRLLTLLTAEEGLITISGKGLTSIKNKYAASAQLFTYSTFQLKKRGEYYYIADAFLIESFMNIRYDIEKLSLANYVCDVAHDVSLVGMGDEELLPLVLNTLYAISNINIPLDIIKGAFEFRTAAAEGFMPDLSACGICGCDITEDSTLDVMNGRIICKKCRAELNNSPEYICDDSTAKIMIRLSLPVLYAIRYIASSPIKKFLSFTLDKTEISLFSVVCERYLLNHLEHNFSSLEYYKKIRTQI